MLDGVLGALNELDHDDRRRELRNIKRPKAPSGNRHRRHDWVQVAVITVLKRRGEPMHARDVHVAAEALLGEPVRWGSVKACLAANVGGPSPRFVGVAPGRYAVGVLPATAPLLDESRRKEAVGHHARSSSNC